MPNVRTRRRERITSEEEERRRCGYEIQVFYQFAPAGGGTRVIEADVIVNGTPLLRLQYAPAATLLRINHGWRGSDHKGFRVDFESGEIVTSQEKINQRPAQTRQVENMRLGVQTTQNLLLVRLVQPNLPVDLTLETTVQ